MAQTNDRLSGLVGKRITAVRPMTRKELAVEDWRPPRWKICVAIELEGGVVLYASQDSEGNGPGMLFGREGEITFVILPEGKPNDDVRH